MALPDIPQREPQKSKDSKKAVMTKSLITTLKEGYDAYKNRPKDKKWTRPSIFRDFALDSFDRKEPKSGN
jgi:hypothetical protein